MIRVNTIRLGHFKNSSEIDYHANNHGLVIMENLVS